MNLLTCNALSQFDRLKHAFSTREGGVSLAPYEHLNLAYHVVDDPLHVTHNHDLLAEALGYERARLVYMRQIHSDLVHVVSDADDFDHPPQCDALITDRAGVALMVMSADCVPIILYDPLLHVAAVVHAGREGAFKNIVARTVQAMRERFTCKPQNLIAALGPSIGVCCYEVGLEHIQKAQQLGFGAMTQEREGRHFLHVSAIVTAQLRACGVQTIEEIALCSACHSDTLFSYRAHGVTGRIGGVIALC
ncbi:MAG: peptidoglycan editing factor PgeF [Campylobacterales bacterium]|nr:peptidoglycan editing factor PgeF [Campylobacterales bacterium]